jgi:hypothetical protein
MVSTHRAVTSKAGCKTRTRSREQGREYWVGEETCELELCHQWTADLGRRAMPGQLRAWRKTASAVISAPTHTSRCALSRHGADQYQILRSWISSMIMAALAEDSFLATRPNNCVISRTISGWLDIVLGHASPLSVCPACKPCSVGMVRNDI